MATADKEEKTAAYRIYVTDAIYSMEIGHRSRYYDMVYRPVSKPEIVSNKSGDEMVDEFVKKHGLTIVDINDNEPQKEVGTNGL